MAHRIGSTDLLASARSAFMHGMDVTLWVCAAIGVVGLLLTLVALPGRPRVAIPSTATAPPTVAAPRVESDRTISSGSERHST